MDGNAGRALADVVLGSGPDDGPGLWLGGPVDRGTLRSEVAARCDLFRSSGLGPGGTVALRLPPSLAYVACLLAAWRCGAQVVLLDHRLTDHEVGRVLERTAPQIVVEPAKAVGGRLSGYFEVEERVTVRAGGAAASTDHVLVQVSSGSTGPSKVVGRTAPDLVAEIERYTRIDGMPRSGGRLVVLNSLIHTFGLVGGLLYGLHAEVEIAVPERITADAMLATLSEGSAPTTVFGVPFHFELLTAARTPVALPHLVGAVTGGELIRPEIPQAFQARFGVPLGECYGMTEVGVIAMDVTGGRRPAAGPPAPGIRTRVEDGELLVATDQSPYIGLADPDRWRDGWLRTRDAAAVGTDGVVAVLGRLDSQVAVGGLKVDLNEVEHALAGLPGVVETVVVWDRAIEAYAVLDEGTTAAEVEDRLAVLIAPFKRPQSLHRLAALPRTATGKRVRDLSVLRAAAAAAAAVPSPAPEH